jgi:protoheme IX farnesyltransferase
MSSIDSIKDEKFISYKSEARVRDYISLLKPRVMTLVVFTAICGIYLAPGKIHPLIALISTLCIAIGSGAAGAINMWYDRDIDKIMSRTKNRPIPKGLITPQDALEFGSALAGFSVLLMAFVVNYLSALVLLIAILFYVFIYTIWLKRRTPQNIVIGGAAGSFPPIIGWACVTGNISIEPIILFLIIFMWTPPHFWALALYKSDDYKLANIPMLPVVAGQKVTKQYILIYTIIMVLTSFIPYFIKMNGMIYLIGSIILGSIFLYYAVKIYINSNNKFAPAMFGYSIFYLFILFGLLVADKIFYQI